MSKGETRTAVIYAVTPLRTGESGQEQLKVCREYAEQRGYDVKSEAWDKLEEGQEWPRRHLARAMAQLPRGGVLVALNRMFVGDVYIRAACMEKLRHRRCRLEFARDVDDDDPLGLMAERLIIAMRGWDRLYRNARIALSLQEKMAKGERASARPPYGMRVDPENPHLVVPDPHEKRVLSLMLQMNDWGWGPTRIARELTKRGYLARNGKPWYPAAVRHILLRETRETHRETP